MVTQRPPLIMPALGPTPTHKTTPVPQAQAKQVCERCRRRKIRCDRTLPTCSNCVRRKQPCQYTLPPKKRQQLVENSLWVQRRVEPLFCPIQPNKFMENPITNTTHAALSPREMSRTATATLLSSPSVVASFGELADNDVGDVNRPMIQAKRPRVNEPVSLHCASDEGDFSEQTQVFCPASSLNSASNKLLSDNGQSLAITFPTSPTLLSSSPLSSPELAPQVQAVTNTRDAWPTLLSQQIVQMRKRLFDNIPVMIESTPGNPQSTITPIIPRPLYRPTDLLFHSHVIYHFLYMSCRLLYLDHVELHYQRFVRRLEAGTMSEALLVSLMMICAPITNHPVVKGMGSHRAGQRYYQRAVELIPDCMDSPDLDSVIVIMVISNYELGQKNIDGYLSLNSVGIRKFMRWKGHLLDHPARHLLPNAIGVGLDMTIPDLPRVEDPLVREHFRILWWGIVHFDILSALMSNQTPLVHLGETYVDKPQQNGSFCEIVEFAMNDPQSAMNTSHEYPLFITRKLYYGGLPTNKYELLGIAHRVTYLCAHKTTNLEQWYHELAGLNQQLDAYQWREFCAEDINDLDKVTARDIASVQRIQEQCTAQFHITLFHSLVTIHLNHTYGITVEALDQFVQPSDHNVMRGASQLGQQVLDSCRIRCWAAVEKVRLTLKNFSVVPMFYGNILMTMVMYSSAVTCIEEVHRAPHSQRASWANQFVDEIFSFLDMLSCEWMANRHVIRRLNFLRKFPARDISLELQFHT
ncbi:hypothetical protein IWQ61_002046 [Dispira simplex]|nr:hypothetical protein IWQ61_002046 [Dispira simplex]